MCPARPFGSSFGLKSFVDSLPLDLRHVRLQSKLSLFISFAKLCPRHTWILRHGGLVIVGGVFYVKTENWIPFAPNGMNGVMLSVASVFFAFIGLLELFVGNYWF